MKRRFDICIFLCVAFFISFLIHLLSYLIFKDGHDLTNFIISAFAVVFFAVLKIVTITDYIYVVTVDETHYKFGNNLFEIGKFVESKNITDKFLLEFSNQKTFDRFLFKNDYAEFYFDRIKTKNGNDIIIYDNKKIKLSKLAKEKRVDIYLEDYQKNSAFINQKIGLIPITNLPEGVSVAYSDNKRFAVVMLLSIDKYLLSCYSLTLKNTFVKPQDVTFDLLYWKHDYRDGEERFATEQQATARTQELIKEYNLNNH